MFNADFYPTPTEIAGRMLDPLDLRGRVVLEPSAGSGNLVQAAIERGASEVLAVEPEPKLRAILASITACQLIGNDWLKIEAEAVSHVDFIVMNPPFSADEAHIIHAWEIAPPGCEIVALCNWNTCNSMYSRAQCQLNNLIDSYGSKECLKNAFSNAERRTNVDIGLVRLTKPGVRPGCEEFSAFFLGPDEIEAQGEGLIPYRVSRDIVNRYTEACKIYDEQLRSASKLQAVLAGYYGKEIGMQVTEKGIPVARNRFRKNLQKEAWKYVFDRLLPLHMATSGLRRDINQFVEDQSHIPFTERNILRMVQIAMGTHDQRVDKAVEEVFDSFTRYTKENRWQVEGWATNSQYLFNRRFIVPGLAEPYIVDSSRVQILIHGFRYSQVDDLIKALCSLSGKRYDDYRYPRGDYTNLSWLRPGEWYEWGFFRFRAYKKGTVHFEFLEEDDWARLNQRVAKVKGYTLPEKLGRKSSKYPKRSTNP